MSDKVQSIAEAVAGELGSLHNSLLLGGYQEADRLIQGIETQFVAATVKRAVGQDWTAPKLEDDAEKRSEAKDSLLALWKPQMPAMDVLSVQPYFNAQGQREWAVLYLGSTDELLLTVTARMSTWRTPQMELFAHPLPTRQNSQGVAALTPEQRETAIVKIQQAIYASISKMHTKNIVSGYQTQRAAYQRFTATVPGSGYLSQGGERFAVASTQREFGQQIDPETTELRFIESWDLGLEGLTVLTAEYFPTDDGLDRWFVCYRLDILDIGFNVFVKFYPHRNPQVEIVHG
jgi:hypothetical protein